MSRTQRVTAADLRAGRIRIPIGDKGDLPAERARLRVRLRTVILDSVAWDPRFGADRERSGVFLVGSRLRDLVAPDEVLTLRASDNNVEID